MKLSGHKSRSIFDRYNIVSEDDLRDAGTRVARYLADRATGQDGHNSGTAGRQVVALAEHRTS